MRLRTSIDTPSIAVVALLAACTGVVTHAADTEPPVITPPGYGFPADPPSDAVVLFDGKDMSQWTLADGKPAPWKIQDGIAISGGGSILSKHHFADAQVHVEFRLPESGKGSGNSGLYFHKLYEVQIIDSFNENKYNPGQQCGALYKEYPPAVNACRAPGEWQSYDIIFHAAKLDENGKVTQPARFTVFLNGVLVQNNRALREGTGGGKNNPMIQKGPLLIQDHGSPVAFRNMWLRPIQAIGESTGHAVTGVAAPAKTPRVTPGAPMTAEKGAIAPSDAVILFDGTTLDGWTNDKWRLGDGYMEVARGTGSNATKKEFGDVQLHVEWATPREVKGSGQGRGNSGVYLHGRYEVQVLDSYENQTYFNAQAAAIYGQYAPLVNASRPPGHWQSYDIIYRAPKYNADGKLTAPGTFTVLHNGVLVHDHVVNKKAPPNGPKGRLPVTGPLLLQDHGNPVRYRNIWYRPLDGE